MEFSKEENKAIETLKEVASDGFDTLGDDISPKMAQNILNVISSQRKEIEELKSKYKDLFFQNFELWEKNIFPMKAIREEYISKDKIREKIKELEKLYGVTLEQTMTSYEMFAFVRSYIDKVKNILKDLY